MCGPSFFSASSCPTYADVVQGPPCLCTTYKKVKDISTNLVRVLCFVGFEIKVREATLEERPDQKNSRRPKRQVTGSSEVNAKQGSTIGQSQEISTAAEE
jgi:hypothetical protein